MDIQNKWVDDTEKRINNMVYPMYIDFMVEHELICANKHQKVLLLKNESILQNYCKESFNVAINHGVRFMPIPVSKNTYCGFIGMEKLSQNGGVDINSFYIRPEYRRRQRAKEFILRLIKVLPAIWSMEIHDRNKIAQKFWRNTMTLAGYSLIKRTIGNNNEKEIKRYFYAPMGSGATVLC